MGRTRLPDGTKRAAIFASVLAAGWMLPATSVAKSIKKVVFSPDDPAALVIVEERQGLHGGSFTFTPVDLTAMRRGDADEEVSKAMDGRLRTANPGLATKGEGLMIPKNMSRFSAAKLPAGDYALTAFSFNMLVYEGFSCFQSGAPVFRLRPGKGNLISAEMLPAGGGSNTLFKFSAAANGSTNDLADAQDIINEHGGLKVKVVVSEFLGFARFRDDKGKVSGCGTGKIVLFDGVPDGSKGVTQ